MQITIRIFARSIVALGLVWLSFFLLLWLGALSMGVPFRISYLVFFHNHMFAVYPALVFAGYSVRMLSQYERFEFGSIIVSNVILVFFSSAIYASFVESVNLISPIFGVFPLDFGIVCSIFFLFVLAVLMFAARRI